MAESYGSAKITEIAELAVLMVMTIRIVTPINCFIWCDSSNCSYNYYRCNGCNDLKAIIPIITVIFIINVMIKTCVLAVIATTYMISFCLS